MKILVTGIGGDVGQGVCQVIRDYYHDVKITGTDTNKINAGSLFCDEQVLLPLATSENYLKSLQELVQLVQPSVLIPTTDAECLIIKNHFNEIFSWSVAVINPGLRALEVGLDKLSTSEFLRQNEMPFPWTVPDSSFTEVVLPCIWKPKFGSGSKGFMRIADAVALEYWSSQQVDGVFQEDLGQKSPELTCGVFRRKSGDVASIIFLRTLAGGATRWAKVLDHAPTERLCEQVALGLNVVGSINIQLKLTPNGPIVFEINPRFSSTVFLRHILGFTDLIWSIEDSFDRCPDISSFQTPIGRTYVKTSIFSPLNSALESERDPIPVDHE